MDTRFSAAIEHGAMPEDLAPAVLERSGMARVRRFLAVLVLLLAPAAHASTPIGWLDAANAWNNGRVQGWALDAAAPSMSIEVHVYFDIGTPYVRGYAVPTNVYRGDVNAVYGVGGNHGFDFEIPSVLLDGAQHQVYAFAIDPHNTGNPLLWGCPKSFSYVPQAPTLVSPVGVGTYDAPPALRWTASSGATQYWVQVDNVADPGATVRVFQGLFTTAQVCGGASCSLVPGTRLVAGSYAWNVQAQNAAGKTWGSGASFTVFAPPGPGLVSPRGDMSMTTPTFGWTASAGATRYWLAVWNDAGAIAYQGPFDPSVCAGSSCAGAPGKAFTAGTYTWNVQAQSAAGVTWGSGASFSLVTPPPPALVSPNGSAGPTPTFQWNAVPGATSYQLAVDPAEGAAVVNTTVAAASVCAGSTCSYAPGTLLYIGASYTWRVLSINAVGGGAWSGRLGFTVAGPPTLVSPSGSIAVPSPTYTWRPVAGATQYFLALDAMVDGVWTRAAQVLADTAAVCSGSTCATTAKTLSAGQYQWSVQAKSGPGGAWSGSMGFSTTTPPPPALVSPNGSAGPTPTFQWNAVPGATSYQLAVDPAEGAAVVNTTVAAASVCAGSTCSYAPGTLLYIGASYTWRVLSINAVGKGDWSGRLGFTVAGTPTLVSPSGSITDPSPVYTWMRVAGATQYFLALDAMVDGVWTRAAQVLADATSICSASTCATPTAKALLMGQYRWSVQAKSGPGGASSGWMSFTVLGPPPASLVSPTGNTYQATPIFNWTASPGATEYWFEIFDVRDPAGGVSVFKGLFTAAAQCSGTSCSLAPGKGLLAGPYSWYVEAKNAVGGTPSGSASFTVLTPTSPTLVSPSGSSENATPTFTWNVSTGATRYWLWIGDQAGVAAWQGHVETTSCSGNTCTGAPGKFLTQGSYTWNVEAQSAAGKTWGAGMGFTVLGPPAPVLVSPAGNIREATPVFTWNASSGATQYWVQVDDVSDPGVAVAVYKGLHATAQVCSGSLCVLAPGKGLVAGPYQLERRGAERRRQDLGLGKVDHGPHADRPDARLSERLERERNAHLHLERLDRGDALLAVDRGPGRRGRLAGARRDDVVLGEHLHRRPRQVPDPGELHLERGGAERRREDVGSGDELHGPRSPGSGARVAGREHSRGHTCLHLERLLGSHAVLGAGRRRLRSWRGCRRVQGAARHGAGVLRIPVCTGAGQGARRGPLSLERRGAERHRQDLGLGKVDHGSHADLPDARLSERLERERDAHLHLERLDRGDALLAVDRGPGRRGRLAGARRDDVVLGEHLHRRPRQVPDPGELHLERGGAERRREDVGSGDGLHGPRSPGSGARVAGREHSRGHTCLHLERLLGSHAVLGAGRRRLRSWRGCRPCTRGCTPRRRCAPDPCVYWRRARASWRAPISWNVEAQNAIGKTWGSARSITVLTPTSPTLVSPSGSSENATPTFTWNVSTGATRYWLWIGDQAGVAAWQGPVETTSCSGNTCTGAPGKFLTQGSYTWNVEAQSAAGKTWGAGMGFTVLGPPAPVLVSPVGNIHEATPVFTWNASSGATQYWVQVDDVSDPGVAVGVYKGLHATAQVCSGSLCVLAPGKGLVAGPYRWNVEAQNATGKTWGDARTFTVLTLPAPVPIFPGGATTAQPTYRWRPVYGATGYLLQVDDATPATVLRERHQASAICSASECTVTPGGALDGGVHWWYVLAQNAAGDGAFSPGMRFVTPTWGGGSGCRGAFLAADFNADGRTDRLCSRDGVTNVALSTGDGFASPAVWLEQEIGSSIVADFNGDGAADLAAYDGTTKVFYVALSTGTQFAAFAAWGTATAAWTDGQTYSCGGGTARPGAGNFDGNGYADVYCRGGNDSMIFVGKSTGSSFTFSIFADYSCWGTTERAGPADFDGDGRDDWYCIDGYGGLYGRLSNGQAFEDMSFQGPGRGVCERDDWTFVDINADGRTDVTCRPNGYVGLSTGSAILDTGSSGHWCDAWEITHPDPNNFEYTVEVLRSQMQPMDTDGDRIPELVCTFDGRYVRDVSVRKWNGETLGPPQGLATQWCRTSVQGGDFDGDGQFELVCDTGAVLRAGTPNVVPDLMVEASNGIGGRTTASYGPSSSFGCNKPPVRQVVTRRPPTTDAGAPPP